jgi:hypothetical protein
VRHLVINSNIFFFFFFFRPPQVWHLTIGLLGSCRRSYPNLVFPLRKNLTAWRDMNPDLLFFGQMQ